MRVAGRSDHWWGICIEHQLGAKLSLAVIPLVGTVSKAIEVIPVVGEVLGNYVSLGLRTWGLFKNIEKAGQTVINLAEDAISRYPKQYNTYREFSDQQLEKAINSQLKQMKKHEEYINDPSLHVPDWKNLTPEHQESLIYHWKNDIQRHDAYFKIAEEILRQRQVEVPNNVLQ